MDWLIELGLSVVEGVVTIGRAIVSATTPVLIRVVETAHRVVNAIREGINKEFRTPPQTERERIERDLEDVNKRIMALKARYRDLGTLSEVDKREHRRLRERRDDLARELEAIDNVFHAEDIVDDDSQYEDVNIDDDLVHILQFHVGQNTNKRCPSPECGRAMILQWRRGLEVVTLQDFFWGCTGYYFEPPKCLHKEKVTAADLRLFVNLSHPEFALSPHDLAEATVKQAPERVRDAMQDIISEARRTKIGVERYRCPIHRERLLPRKNKNPTTLLDEFLLGCPRWLPENAGCNFLIKLKSPAQIAAVLDASGAGGVVAVIDGSNSHSKRSNAGKPWAREDEVALAQAFDAGATIDQLCDTFRRNEGGIRSRLVKLGKLTSVTELRVGT